MNIKLAEVALVGSLGSLPVCLCTRGSQRRDTRCQNLFLRRHDIHATIPHQLGLDHTRLTMKSHGFDRRLTDVHGEGDSRDREVKDLGLYQFFGSQFPGNQIFPMQENIDSQETPRIIS